MIDIKHLAIVNIFAPLKKFTKARFDCIIIKQLLIKPDVIRFVLDYISMLDNV